MLENSTMTIEEKQNQLVEDFAFFEDWTDKYEHIITIGKSLQALDEKNKTASNLIKGCQSRVWLHAEFDQEKIVFSADSDAIITKGLVGMICDVFSNQSPEDIINADLHFIDDIGLKDHLSPTRSNGLLSMLKQIKFYALAYNAKSSEK